MTVAPGRRCLLCVVFFTLAALPASAEIMQRIHAGIEGVARGMDYVGRRAGDLIGPGVSLSGEEAAHSYHRTFEQQYSSGPSPMVALSNEFGDIRVGTWDERLVRVTTDITVGAESEALAEQLAHLIEISMSHGEDYFECRTRLPEIKSGGRISIMVNYDVLIPREAGLAVDNFFGDVRIADINGLLAADIHYGGLDLSQIQGRARVRVQGEFPVKVRGLHQGGTFKLQGATAEFSEVNGPLEINYFRGMVTVKQPGPDAQITISGDSGRTQVVLPPGATPDLTAMVLYGKLDSDLDVVRTLRGPRLMARHPNAAGTQQISISVLFSDVAVLIEGNEEGTEGVLGDDQKLFTDAITETIAAMPGDAVHILAMPGNIRIEGADTDRISVEATRIVWAPSAAAAMDARDALSATIAREDGIVRIQTKATQNLADFGCDSYRVDLRIICPRELLVTLDSEEGVSSIDGLGAGVAVTQNKGEVSLEHIKGPVRITNNSGAITARSCSGPIEATARYGPVVLEEIYGDVRVDNSEGRVHIDAPRAAVHVRQKDGDVRLLCLDPIQGEFDILVENGNLSVFIAPESDASIQVNALRGRVQSSLPLSGSISRDAQEFFGRINAGAIAVRLASVDGNIFLN